MSADTANLSRTVSAMRPMVPAKDFELSKRFYIELGFQPRPLTERLVEMQLGAFSFILQDFYVREWADNFVVHVTVSDVGLWWDHIRSLDLAARYGVKLQPPEHFVWLISITATIVLSCSRAVRDLLASKRKCCDMGELHR
jgi:hypothetical protein